ncbi:MAG TPA: hypothetical protein V6D17_14650 [Candidatus Obscuribacterales bacterium]
MNRKLFLLASLFVLLTLVALVQPALCSGDRDKEKDKDFKGVSSGLLVHATPQIIYDSIKELRKRTPDTVKEVSKSEGECILEEHFDNLPFVGKATCIYVEKYVPGKLIEYKMLHSDKFKAFEGKWEITPTADETESHVQLSSFVMLDLPIPFLKQITNSQTMKGVKERLEAVKKMAEQHQQTLGSAIPSRQ